MKFHIVGAHRESADDIELLLEAETATDAAAKANEMNVMVEKTVPVATAMHLGGTLLEYHTLRCDFGDLTTHLNKYGAEGWRALTIHHDPHDDKMVRCVMERPKVG